MQGFGNAGRDVGARAQRRLAPLVRRFSLKGLNHASSKFTRRRFLFDPAAHGGGSMAMAIFYVLGVLAGAGAALLGDPPHTA